MSTQPPSQPISRAVERLAHPSGTAYAVIEFWDRSVYRIEPFRDDDYIELGRRQVAPGIYYNQIVSRRPNFTATRLPKWPDLIGLEAWSVMTFQWTYQSLTPPEEPR